MARREESGESSLVPHSLFRVPTFLPSLWEDMSERMNQLMGIQGNTDVTVSEDDQNVYVETHLPGLKAEDIDISFQRNTLWIKGEKREEEKDQEKKYYRRAQNSFFYQVELPSQVEEETEQAQFQDGVLKITFKKTRQSQVHKIVVSNQNKGQSKNNK